MAHRRRSRGGAHSGLSAISDLALAATDALVADPAPREPLLACLRGHAGVEEQGS